MQEVWGGEGANVSARVRMLRACGVKAAHMALATACLGYARFFCVRSARHGRPSRCLRDERSAWGSGRCMLLPDSLLFVKREDARRASSLTTTPSSLCIDGLPRAPP